VAVVDVQSTRQLAVAARDVHHGYCPEVPGANGQGSTVDECRSSLRSAVELILQDRLEDALRGVPDDAIRELVTVA